MLYTLNTWLLVWSVAVTVTWGQTTVTSTSCDLSGSSGVTDKLDTVVTLVVNMAEELRQVKSELVSVTSQLTSVQSELGKLKTESLSTKVELLTELRPPYGEQNPRVFHAESPAGHYQLTYSDAVAHCEALGARIATKAQLQTALNLGMSVCACGWVEGQEVWYPRVWNWDGCGGKKTVGPALIGCSYAKNDVYCFK